MTADIKIKDPVAFDAWVEELDALHARMLAKLAHDQETLAELGREESALTGPEDCAEALAAAHAHFRAQKAHLTAHIAGFTAAADQVAARIAAIRLWKAVVTGIDHGSASRVFTI